MMEDQARAKRNEKKRKKQLERETQQIMTNLVEYNDLGSIAVSN